MSRYPLDPLPYGWFHAAFSEDLGPADVEPLHMHDRHFVLWRDEEGEPHVMDAHCAHLGAHLGYGGRVEGCTIRCPFHAWRYDGTGQCVEIPYVEKAHRLAAVAAHPVVERNGMVWMWWHPDGEAPRWEVPEVPEWSDPGWTSEYVRQHWPIRTQWREVAENGIDLTHFHYLHGVATIPKLEFGDYDGPVWHSNSVHEVNTPLGRRRGNFEVKLHGPGFAWLRFGIEDLVEILFVITITPIDREHIDNRFSFLARHPVRDDVQDMAPALIQEVIDQVTDDVPIWENKITKDPPLLALGDGPIVKFREWASQFSAGDPGTAAGPATGQAPRSVAVAS
jgi:phenylpropionate dioxygenase-like ring-hydroxylating dioxygenase large terminal subunit